MKRITETRNDTAAKRLLPTVDGKRDAGGRPTSQGILFGHRGYSALAPENTLAAFRVLKERGLPAVELDIRCCASNDLVVAHDATLARTAGSPARISKLSYDQLREFDVGSWFSGSFRGERILLLKEVFALLGEDVIYDIEVKTEGAGNAAHGLRTLVQLVSASIRHAGLTERTIVSSFNPFALAAFRRAEPRIPTALIYSKDPRAPIPARTEPAKLLVPNELLKPDLAAFRKERGEHSSREPRLVWTVDSPIRIRELMRAGVYGIISNDPLGVAASGGAAR